MKAEKLLAALLLGAGAATLATPASTALAQGTDAPAEARDAVPPGTAVDDEEADPLGFELGVDYTTAYFFRGYNIEDTGYIIQPFAEVSYEYDLQDDWSITPHAGIWNSIHEHKQGGDDGWEHLFETDWFLGAKLGYGNWSLDVVWYLYTYPSGAFGLRETQEFDFTLAYDDTEWAEDVNMPFALAPYVLFATETSDKNGTNDDYLEVGVEPSFELDNVADGLALSVPVALGMSTDSFYVDPDDGSNEFLGYLSIGLSASYPLNVFEGYGDWSLTGSVTYIQLFADGLEAANDGGKDYELIGTIGLGISL
jgi:hypothetical protein